MVPVGGTKRRKVEKGAQATNGPTFSGQGETILWTINMEECNRRLRCTGGLYHQLLLALLHKLNCAPAAMKCSLEVQDSVGHVLAYWARTGSHDPIKFRSRSISSPLRGSSVSCRRLALCIEHIEGAHGAQAGSLASALVRAGQRPGSADGEANPMSGADAAARLAKMRATDASLPAIKQDAAVRLLRWVATLHTLGSRFCSPCLPRLMSVLACREALVCASLTILTTAQ